MVACSASTCRRPPRSGGTRGRTLGALPASVSPTRTGFKSGSQTAPGLATPPVAAGSRQRGHMRPPPAARVRAMVHAGGASLGGPGRGAAAGPRRDNLHAPARVASVELEPSWSWETSRESWAPGCGLAGASEARPNLLGGLVGQAGGGGSPRPPPRPSPRVLGTKAECLHWGCEDNGPGMEFTSSGWGWEEPFGSCCYDGTRGPTRPTGTEGTEGWRGQV